MHTGIFECNISFIFKFLKQDVHESHFVVMTDDDFNISEIVNISVLLSFYTIINDCIK